MAAEEPDVFLSERLVLGPPDRADVRVGSHLDGEYQAFLQHLREKEGESPRGTPAHCLVARGAPRYSGTALWDSALRCPTYYERDILYPP